MNDVATLQKFDCVDFVLRGEGEIAFPALINSLKSDASLNDVGNLTYRSGDEIVVNPELPLIPDLDTLPFPYLEKVDLSPEDAIWWRSGADARSSATFVSPRRTGSVNIG